MKTTLRWLRPLTLVAILAWVAAPALAQEEAPAEAADDDAGAGSAPSPEEEEAVQLAATPDEAPGETEETDEALAEEAEEVALAPEPVLEAEPVEEARLPIADPVEEPVDAPFVSPSPSLDPCRTDLRSRPIGPLQVGSLDGNLGVAHRACPREELAIGGEALIVAHTSDFYGNLRFDGRARISAPLFDPRVEAFLSWEALRYQTVISSVSASYLGLGYLSWGVAGQVYAEGDRVVAVTGRMVLPTTSGLDPQNAPLAMDLGLTGAWQVDPAVRLHMWVNVLGSVGLGAPAAPQAGLRVGGGADLRAAEWISFVLELASGFGYSSGVDYLAAQAGVRLALGTEVGLELAGFVPFLGPRTFEDGALQLAASLMLNWRLR